MPSETPLRNSKNPVSITPNAKNTETDHSKVPDKVLKIIKRGIEEVEIGADAEEKVQMVRDTVELFGILAQELPYCGAHVATLLSERARWHVLGAKMAELAIQVGIATPHGMLLLDKAMLMGARAESSAIKAYNLSMRLAEFEANKQDTAVKTPWLQTDDDED